MPDYEVECNRNRELLRVHGEDIAALKEALRRHDVETAAIWRRMMHMDKERKAEYHTLLEVITGNKVANAVLQSKWKTTGAFVVGILTIFGGVVGLITLAYKAFTE